MSEEKTLIVNCIECGALLPKDLVDQLIQGHVVYCEQCGFENRASDFNIQQLKEYYKSSTSTDYKDILKSTGKRFIGLVRSKIKDIKEENKK